jgi:ribosomal protein S18 acetylase RimI-like enzyme
MSSELVLPDGYTGRAATLDDVDAIHRLMAAGEQELNGRVEVASDGVRADLLRPGLVLAADTRLVQDVAGNLAGWAWQNQGRRSQIDVHPAFRGQGIGGALLDWAEARAAERGSQQAAQTVDDKDLAATALLRSRGYEVLATNWLLEMPVATEPLLPELPADIHVRPFKPGDEKAAYQLIQDAFDEWQPRRQPYDEWARLMIERESFVPELSPVAFVGDELVGAALCLDVPGSDEGYVEQLAVRRDQRNKGLARALLAVASRKFYRRGSRNLALWTHSGTGALAMYERLGMTVRRSTTVYRKPLSAS